MPCNRIDSVLDDYLDSTLPRDAASRMTQHLERCLDCRATLDQAAAVSAKLRALPVEGPSQAFFATALERAKQTSIPATEVPSARRYFPSAVAAAVLIWFAGSFLYDASTRTALPGLPEVAMSIDEIHPVNLVFSSDTALVDARVSLLLPQGIELAGYSGRRELSWTTDLQAGKNVLQLPIVAHASVDSEIIARLQHGTANKTFRVKVRVI